MATKQHLNVMKKPLALFSQKPMTGFYRDGYCRTGPDDYGNHAVAGILTSPFLSFSASRGNDLAAFGLKPGCKWCLCANRWKEAFEAYQSGEVKDKEVVPKVFLNATHESALRSVGLEDLKGFAEEGAVDVAEGA